MNYPRSNEDKIDERLADERQMHPGCDLSPLKLAPHPVGETRRKIRPGNYPALCEFPGFLPGISEFSQLNATTHRDAG